jgi:hypothetical protein
VELGASVPILLTNRQRRALADPDARVALHVLRHFLGARFRSVPHGSLPDIFPLTEELFQKVARKLGHPLGIKRIRGLLRELRQAGVLEPAGSYRQLYRNAPGDGAFRVPLFRLAVSFASAKGKRPVGRGPRVKRSKHPRWWLHPLFGDYGGRPPPQLGLDRARQMRSIDELTNSECRRVYSLWF